MNLEVEVYVSLEGSASNPGTIEQPLGTLHQAQMKIRELKKSGLQQTGIQVLVRAGTYELAEPLILGPEDSGTVDNPITYRAYPGERVTISGGRRLISQWEPLEDGVWSARLSKNEVGGDEYDQLFVNGERQIRARFPNYDPSNPLVGGPGYRNAAGGNNRLPDTELRFHPDSFTTKRWSNPATGIVHAFQSHYWGNMQYRIRDVDWDQHIIHLGAGGFQLQRTFGINDKSKFYVENIREELDVPGEWFYDKNEGVLYYYPLPGVDLHQADVAIAHLKQLVELRGTSTDPVTNVVWEGFIFTNTRATSMEDYEDLARGDWSIHRGGAVFMENAENCTIRDCFFDTVGGNGVFISRYNRRNTVTGCKFERAGESAVCVVGSPQAVRMYQTWQDEVSGRLPEPDFTVGPLNKDYPEACVISNNIIRDIGIYGKQTAGVFISMSRRITVSHNTIYEVPRAGICINDGTWGGHIIQHNDLWETVRETGDHGPFNSWGRERQWSFRPEGMIKEAVFWDALEPVIICNNRLANHRKSVGVSNWAIDLDDGSSNYHIYNNICLGSTLKLRDGYYRKVENNIMVSAVPLGWHVWPKDSEDVFVRNIVVISGVRPGDQEPTDSMLGPIRMPEHPWGKQFDYNLYWNVNTKAFLAKERPAGREYEWEAWRAKGYDIHSLLADPLFVDPEAGDYGIRDDSPAWELGFRPFPMDQFGHQQTRITPNGGEFEQTIRVTIEEDDRGGEVWFTTDGSEPSPDSPDSSRYAGPISLEKTVTVKAWTYKEGRAQGFMQTASFIKVDELVRPSWLSTLLSVKRKSEETSGSDQGREHREMIWLGATMTDIVEGDVIGALGGHNEGVLIVNVPESSAAYKFGCQKYDVVVEWDGDPILTLQDFVMKCHKPERPPQEMIVLRGYTKLLLKSDLEER